MKRRKNADDRLRRLTRAAESGDREAQAQLERELERVGKKPPRKIETWYLRLRESITGLLLDGAKKKPKESWRVRFPYYVASFIGVRSRFEVIPEEVVAILKGEESPYDPSLGLQVTKKGLIWIVKLDIPVPDRYL